MKNYCTQNNGDCKTCSLANYGRDCENNPIEDNESKEDLEYKEREHYREVIKSES